MNSYINYLIESNIALMLFFGAYVLLLRNETDFRIKRMFLISGLISAVLFPLLHFQNEYTAIPALRNLVSTYMLPEISITDGAVAGSSTSTIQNSIWQLLPFVYLVGAAGFLLLLSTRILSLVRLIRKSKPNRVGKYKIVESEINKPPYSFFNFIFVGQAGKFSEAEKARIVRHEMVHANQLHSADILLVHAAAILFWFNPILRWYKKTFIQLHEFEADARAAEGYAVNEYCSLLAKVALLSADIKLASHFSNSLTIKRIKMMRTLKQKIQVWKLTAIASMIPLIFFIVACQDQVLDDITEIAKNANNALIVPEAVQARYDQVRQQNPDSKYILVEFNEAADDLLAKMEKEHGVPKSIELYTPDATDVPADDQNFDMKLDTHSNSKVKTYAIIEYNGMMNTLSDLSKSGEVYSVVEETASPAGGIPTFYEFIARNMQYPLEARRKGIEGKVFVEFVVQTDGSLSNIKVLKSISPELDQEAVRMVKASPNWNPGKIEGKPVNQRMVMPFAFKLGDSSWEDATKTPNGSLSEVVAAGLREQ